MSSSKSAKRAKVLISNLETKGDSSDDELIELEENIPLLNQPLLEENNQPQPEENGIQHDQDEMRTYTKGKSKRRKEFWNDFKPYRDKDNKKRAECIHCHKTFAADPNTNGTKNLSKHWKTCVENPTNKSKGTQSKLILETIDSESGHCRMRNWVLNENEVREALIEMIIVDEFPFRCVEKPGMKKFLSVACPTFRLPSRVTVSRDCYDLFLKEKEILKVFLVNSCQRVCLTTDTWTSIQRVNYMTLTAHFIDNDWNLQKKILNFCPIGSHKGDAIARGIEDCLRGWGLCDKVFSITVDNASANDTACRHLRQMVIDSGNCINLGKNLHMRCVAHIINLIVTDGLSMHSAHVDKVKAVIKYVRSSPARLNVFKQQAEKLKIDSKSSLTLDVSTRWNSTYMMLDIALKYRSVFGRLDTPRDANGEILGRISLEEWAKIEILVKFLKEFYDLTNRVSGSSYVTINTVFFHIGHIINLLNEWLQSSDPDCVAMAHDMKIKCDKYWGDLEKMNMLIFIALILDPAYKFCGVQVALCTLYGREVGEALASKVKEFAYGLFDEYRNMYGSTPCGSEIMASSSGSSALMDGDGPSFLKDINQHMKMRLTQSNPDGLLRTEFDLYLYEQVGTNEKDVLTWWRLHGPRFPIVSHMARDVLAIPVSTVPSESAFSTGCRTIDQFRSSLAPKNVQALICVQDWLRGRSQTKEGVSLEELERFESDIDQGASASNIDNDNELVYVYD